MGVPKNQGSQYRTPNSGALIRTPAQKSPNSWKQPGILGYHPMIHTFMYVLMQFLGALFGALLSGSLLPHGLQFVMRGDGGPGCLDHESGAIPDSVDGLMLMKWEFLMTFMLLYASLMCGLDSPATCGSWTPMVAGMTMVACGGSGGRFTGAALNPARVVGPVVVYGCGSAIVPYYLAAHLAATVLACCGVALGARTGPLNPAISTLALGLSRREAWKLWLTGNPPSRICCSLTETCQTMHDHHAKVMAIYEGKPVNHEEMTRNNTHDLQRLFGAEVKAVHRSPSQWSVLSSPREADREVALMLQHPAITNREAQPDFSPTTILR